MAKRPKPRLRTLPPRLKPINQAIAAPLPRANEAFYQSAAWRSFSRDIVAERGRVCEDCGRAVPVPERIHCDHVEELTDGGPRFDRRNITVRCTACHTAKTAAARAERIQGG